METGHKTSFVNFSCKPYLTITIITIATILPGAADWVAVNGTQIERRQLLVLVYQTPSMASSVCQLVQD